MGLRLLDSWLNSSNVSRPRRSRLRKKQRLLRRPKPMQMPRKLLPKRRRPGKLQLPTRSVRKKRRLRRPLLLPRKRLLRMCRRRRAYKKRKIIYPHKRAPLARIRNSLRKNRQHNNTQSQHKTLKRYHQRRLLIPRTPRSLLRKQMRLSLRRTSKLDRT